MLFKVGATLIQGATFIFLQNVPGGSFIQGAKSIMDSRIVVQIWEFSSHISLCAPVHTAEAANDSG